jgi:hypothetical protein
MALHLLLFAVYMVTTALKTLQVGKWLSNNTENNFNRSIIMYTISIWSLFFDQLVLCYLIYTFSAPVSGIIDIHEGNLRLSSVSHRTDSTVRQSTSYAVKESTRMSARLPSQLLIEQPANSSSAGTVQQELLTEYSAEGEDF